jgi:hypothetical protein
MKDVWVAIIRDHPTARAVGKAHSMKRVEAILGPQKGRESFVNSRKQPVTTGKQLSRSASVLGNTCRSENGSRTDF